MMTHACDNNNIYSYLHVYIHSRCSGKRERVGAHIRYMLAGSTEDHISGVKLSDIPSEFNNRLYHHKPKPKLHFHYNGLAANVI